MKKALQIISMIFSLFFFYMFYDSYLKQDFNSEGKAFDPINGVSYNESAFIWGVLALIFCIPFLLNLFSSLKKIKKLF